MPPPAADPPLTDSPWLWAMLFTGVGLAMLLATGGKFGNRQAGIERKYQARQAVASGELKVHNQGDGNKRVENAPAYSTAEKTVVPLWPLECLLGIICLGSLVMLLRTRAAPAKPSP